VQAGADDDRLSGDQGGFWRPVEYRACGGDRRPRSGPARDRWGGTPRNEGQDLRLSIAEPFASTGPIESNGAARPRRNIATRTTELLNTLRDNAFDPSGEPVAWFYDPPWTLPFRRRNEVAVTVTPR
jgi:hypothetical protein